MIGDTPESESDTTEHIFQHLKISNEENFLKESLDLLQKNSQNNKPVFLSLSLRKIQAGKPHSELVVRSYIYIQKALELVKAFPIRLLLPYLFLKR